MKPTISSLKFAHDFGIRHSDLMRKIRKFKCSTDFTERNFSLSTYKDSTGRTHLTAQIEKLKEYKTTLINDAVTGKIKVA